MAKKKKENPIDYEFNKDNIFNWENRSSLPTGEYLIQFDDDTIKKVFIDLNLPAAQESKLTDAEKIAFLLYQYNMLKHQNYIQNKFKNNEDQLIDLLIKQNDELKENAKEACSYLTAIDVPEFTKIIGRIKKILE